MTDPPAKQGDYAYLLHIVRSLKSKGKVRIPNWRFRREQLNRLPVRHEDWGY